MGGEIGSDQVTGRDHLGDEALVPDAIRCLVGGQPDQGRRDRVPLAETLLEVGFVLGHSDDRSRSRAPRFTLVDRASRRCVVRA